MRASTAILLVLVWGSLSAARASTHPLAAAADYYSARHDFREAGRLWAEILRQRPDDVTALFRVAELKLLLEGRAASREVLLSYLTTHDDRLPQDTRRAVRARLSSLQSLFLTEEGQSLFLRGVAKQRAGDLPGALVLLTQAADLEGGHPSILKAKAQCEKAQSLFTPYYASLKLANQADPFDSDAAVALAEAHLYFESPESAATLLPTDGETVRSIRERTALGVALLESGKPGDAVRTLQTALEHERKAVHPIVYFALGHAMAARPGASAEASQYLERFLAASAPPHQTLVDGWDPYRTNEKRSLAQKLLSRLRPPSDQ